MTSRVLVGRVLPPVFFPRRSFRIIERNAIVAKASWLVFFSGFFEPLFYLFALGGGLGSLTGDIVLDDGSIITYAAFIAPSLLAASSMNGALYEATTNLFFKLRYGQVYHGMMATPLGPVDIAYGEIGWALIRGLSYAVAFLIITIVMGLVSSPIAVLAVPAAVLIGWGFAGPGLVAATYMRTWQDFDLFNLVVLPMFLFSATFYPISVYPTWLQVFTHLSPLYHAVVLMRMLMLNAIDWTILWHGGFLLALGTVCMAWGIRRVNGMLQP